MNNPFKKLFIKIKKFSCKLSFSICRSKCSVNLEGKDKKDKDTEAKPPHPQGESTHRGRETK